MRKKIKVKKKSKEAKVRKKVKKTAAQKKLNELFNEMLRAHPDGISSTSTRKFNQIREFLSEITGVSEDDMYITAAGTRPGNLNVRLSQGLQASKHTKLGLGVLKAEKTNKAAIHRLSKSALASASNFLGRGDAQYDAFGILVQVGKELRLTRLTEGKGSNLYSKLKTHFPDLVLKELEDAVVKEIESEVDKLDESIVEEFHESCSRAGLIFSKSIIVRFLASQLAKPFVILTGLSGSGKTKLAHAFASWITASDGSKYVIVSVGADWNNNENILGYPNAIVPGAYVKPTNAALNIILDADNDPENPYFLILDEMNLSHVERYFADILSAIESGKEIYLHPGDSDWDGVPPSIKLPSNLYILGTVNVDETTYMFSPKVLDRANVIEFRVDEDEMDWFLNEPSSVDMESLEAKGLKFAKSFVEESQKEHDIEKLEIDGVKIGPQLKEHLLKFFGELSDIGAEFGYRSAMEISRFVYFYGQIAGLDWEFEDALDAVVVQKLLPKLHGSRAKLEHVLETLATSCGETGCPISEEKLARMQKQLVYQGFASFAEA